MRPRRGAVLMAALLWAAPLAGAPLTGIHGAVYREDTDHPLPGALVVLYDAGDLFLDSTYSRDDGSFRLRPPSDKGRVSIVATAPGSSRKRALDYNPAKAAPAVTFILTSEKESLWRQAGGFLLNTLGAVFGSVVGLLVGLLFRRLVEDPAAAREKRNLFLSELEASVNEALAQIPKTAPGAALPQVTAAVKRIRQLFERRADVENALDRLDKTKGRSSFRALLEELSTAERLLGAAQGKASATQDANVLEVEKILRKLREPTLV